MVEKRQMPKRGRSLHVLRELRRRIEDGTYAVETKLPAERLLAEEFGVSRVTIRRSLERLKQDGMVARRPGFGNVVTAAMPVAQSVPPSVGFVVQHLDNPYYAAFASSLETVLRAHDLNMVLAGTGQNPDEELRCLQRMSELQVRGIILCVPDQLHHPEAVRSFVEQRMPVVIIGDRQSGVSVDTVDSDNRAGMSAAIDHLLELGHTRIGFLSAMAHGRRDVRMELTIELLQLRGLAPGPMVAVQIPDLEGGRLAFDHMLQHSERPSAVLCTNDITAIGAVQRAFELGLSIPAEISIVGYDDIPMAGMAAVPLTTVAVPLDELAELAFERLSTRTGGYAGRPIHLAIEPSLVVRRSTAKP